MRRSALYLLGLVVAVLVALGLVVLFSASEVRSLRLCGKPWLFVLKQAGYVAAGLVLAWIVSRIDYHRWRDQWGLTVFVAAVVLVLLLLVFLFPAVKGSHRWIPLPGGVNLQPGEFAKLMTVLVVSVWMDKAGWQVELFKRGALIPAALIGVFATPVMFEPDFGSVMVISLVGFMLMFLAGTRVLHLLPIAAAGLSVVIYKILTNANRMARLSASENYQGDMSIVAISRGGITGVGLNQSMQKQHYLPEAWTDFIFAVGAEEMGLIFTVCVLLLYLSFFCLSLYIARKAPDRLGKLIVMGAATVIFFQAMFNLGVVCEAFPTKGMALPFFSYGGTNMVTAFLAVGLIFAVGRRSLDDVRQERLFTRKTQTY